MRHFVLFSALLAVLLAASEGRAQDPTLRFAEVTVDASAGRMPISPYLYGRNGVFDGDATPEIVRESGLRITRESHGNNCTKYNWREDLSSHPDWYNNVYEQGLHDRARRIHDDYDGLEGLFGLQVLGWVAETDGHNFREQEADPRPEPHENLCGGGDPDLYLIPWTAKDTVDILDHWFGAGGLGLDPARFRYWHLDNEPGCWVSTHDDVDTASMTGEECARKYVAVAKELKTRYPDVRVMAPGFTAEWMWWNWHNEFVDGKPWAEYFIKRMAEESRAAGVRLIDVIDYHSYIGGDATEAEVLQEHRVFYDWSYELPRANGCKRYPDGGWHEDQRVEAIFARTEDWLAEYFGPGHGITIGVTEAAGWDKSEMVAALWYASMLGTYADHGVEVFTPWGWRESAWEVLHLFTHYAQPIRVEAVCTGEPLVSAYASLSEDGRAMTVMLLNRDPDSACEVALETSGFARAEGASETLLLSDLPEGERTFRTREDNALVHGTANEEGGITTVRVPPYSIMAVVLGGT